VLELLPMLMVPSDHWSDHYPGLNDCVSAQDMRNPVHTSISLIADVNGFLVKRMREKS
jgi:hypothetical protein